MGKKSALIVLLLLPFIFVMMLSCAKKSPTEPIATITPTHTATATVTPVAIADFEESSCVTSIVCSDCTNQVLGATSTGVDLYSRNCVSLSSQPAEYGTKAYSVSATVKSDNSAWFGAYPKTRSANGIGSDFSAYNRLNLKYKVLTNAAAGEKIMLSAAIQDPSISNRLEKDGIELDNSGNWASLSLDINTFTVASLMTAAEILENTDEIRFLIRADGDGITTPFVEFIFDNATMSKQ